MDKLFTLIQKTPLQQKIALLATVIALMGGMYYWTVYRNQRNEITRLSATLNQLKNNVTEKRAIAAQRKEFFERLESYRKQLDEAKKNLPDDSNMDQLLRTLTKLSEKSDMRIVKFTPQPEVRQNFYAEIPVKMEIEGNYHEIASFFSMITKENRIIHISDISLRDPQVRNGKVVLKASCVARTFRSLPEQAAVPSKGAPAAPATKGAT
jgi:type IV pilus assembly protein PilO